MTGISLFDITRAALREQICILLGQDGPERPANGRLYRMLRALDNARLAEGHCGEPLICNLTELLDGLCAALATLLAARGHDLYTALPKAQLYARLNPDAITAAACNLIVNAFEHSGAQRVRLRLTSSSGNAVITVSDKGQGIAAASLLGLGLPAVKRICEAFGGNLKTATGGGTSVTITLPLCERPDPISRYRAPECIDYLLDRFSRAYVAVRAMDE